MINVILALVIGVAVGWALCTMWMVARLGRNSVWLNKEALTAREDADEQAKTYALTAAADADNDLALLGFLENGQVSDVKRVLTYKLGLFYHRWAARPHKEVPDSIRRSISAISDAAKEFDSVRTVLTHDPETGPPPA